MSAWLSQYEGMNGFVAIDIHGKPILADLKLSFVTEGETTEACVSITPQEGLSGAWHAHFYVQWHNHLQKHGWRVERLHPLLQGAVAYRPVEQPQVELIKQTYREYWEEWLRTRRAKD